MNYRAVAKRDGAAWTVIVEHGDGSLAGGTTARGLDLVETNVRALIGETDGILDDLEITVDVQIPACTEQRIELAERLCEDAERELSAAIVELLEWRLPVRDISWLFDRRQLVPRPRPVSISNAEIAEFGLLFYPDVVGLRWEDHGRFETITCRDCVEAHRHRYVDAPPEELNELIRVASPETFCHDCKASLNGDEPDEPSLDERQWDAE